MANSSTTKWMLGTSASAMVALPEPDLGSVTRPLTNVGGKHTSVRGSNTMDVFARKRTWAMTWSGIDPRGPLYATIVQWWDPDSTSFRGYGPFVLNDPLLTARLPTVNVTDLSEDSKHSGSSTLTITIEEV